MNDAPSTVLIVKTSALGDIVQSFNVLDYLHKKWPNIQIDWVVESPLSSIVSAHPLVSETISVNLKGLRRFGPAWKELGAGFRNLRKKKYDLVFDLQGNCKSGVITFLSRGKVKVGFGWNSVRERPNMLATHVRFEVPREMNIRLQYVQLLQSYFRDSLPAAASGVRFRLTPEEKTRVESILALPQLSAPMRIMVCPGSKWANKQLPLETLVAFLHRIQEQHQASFLLMWGADSEKLLCEQIQARFPKNSLVIDKLPIPTWQNLMNETHLVIAVDSSALHLCGTTHTPSFSLFGPTSPEIFKPLGARHFAIQGPCPYGRTFPKACPLLRTCPTGACLRDLSADRLYHRFASWWKRS